MALSPTSSRGGGGSSVVISETEPGSPTDGAIWVRLQDNTQTYQLYCYDANAPAWVQASAGVTAESYDGQARQVGTLVGDADDGNFSGLTVNPVNPIVTLAMMNSDGDVVGQLAIDSGQMFMEFDNARFTRDTTGWKLQQLPTTDPAVADYLWVDPVTHVLKVSAGA